MFSRATPTPPILVVLTNTHISEAFRIDFDNKHLCFYGQQQNHHFLVFGGGSTKHSCFFMRGVIVPPSKLIVTHIWFNYKGVDRTKHRLL